MRATAVRWDDAHFPWAFVGYFPTLADAAAIAVLDWCWDQWSSSCGITHERVLNAKDADVIIDTAFIDGPLNKLATTETPNGVSRVRLVFDNAEQWVLWENAKGLEVDLIKVACHEIGHAIGLPHSDEPCLMEAKHKNGFRVPQELDKIEAQKLYGPPYFISVDGVGFRSVDKVVEQTYIDFKWLPTDVWLPCLGFLCSRCLKVIEGKAVTALDLDMKGGFSYHEKCVT